ncbi:hypothetical protein [Neomicrococcus lactis]|uniref:Uncharacterized protein n=1 Tax=Neomicrococcus lactis TaxID=732241 RepID=A0A7W9DBB7_9MICC|nr:hypothetical protein [Neomicrococcus lactis]MBB5598533.1 hypothetical protein [Neomicrococcus lactis]
MKNAHSLDHSLSAFVLRWGIAATHARFFADVAGGDFLPPAADLTSTGLYAQARSGESGDANLDDFGYTSKGQPRYALAGALWDERADTAYNLSWHREGGHNGPEAPEWLRLSNEAADNRVADPSTVTWFNGSTWQTSGRRMEAERAPLAQSRTGVALSPVDTHEPWKDKFLSAAVPFASDQQTVEFIQSLIDQAHPEEQPEGDPLAVAKSSMNAFLAPNVIASDANLESHFRTLATYVTAKDPSAAAVQAGIANIRRVYAHLTSAAPLGTAGDASVLNYDAVARLLQPSEGPALVRVWDVKRLQPFVSSSDEGVLNMVRQVIIAWAQAAITEAEQEVPFDERRFTFTRFGLTARTPDGYGTTGLVALAPSRVVVFGWHAGTPSGVESADFQRFFGLNARSTKAPQWVPVGFLEWLTERRAAQLQWFDRGQWSAAVPLVEAAIRPFGAAGAGGFNLSHVAPALLSLRVGQSQAPAVTAEDNNEVRAMKEALFAYLAGDAVLSVGHRTYPAFNDEATRVRGEARAKVTSTVRQRIQSAAALAAVDHVLSGDDEARFQPITVDMSEEFVADDVEVAAETTTDRLVAEALDRSAVSHIPDSAWDVESQLAERVQELGLANQLRKTEVERLCRQALGPVMGLKTGTPASVISPHLQRVASEFGVETPEERINAAIEMLQAAAEHVSHSVLPRPQRW